MTPEQQTLVRGSFAKVAPIAAQAAAMFYDRLFALDPRVGAPLFKGDMTEQGQKLMAMIGTAVCQSAPALGTSPFRRCAISASGMAATWRQGRGLRHGGRRLAMDARARAGRRFPLPPPATPGRVACYGVLAREMKTAAAGT